MKRVLIPKAKEIFFLIADSITIHMNENVFDPKGRKNFLFKRGFDNHS